MHLWLWLFAPRPFQRNWNLYLYHTRGSFKRKEKGNICIGFSFLWSYCSRVDINNQQMPFLSDFEFKQTLLKNFYKCFRKKNHFAHQINFMSKNQYSMTQLYWSFYKRRKEEYNRGKRRGGSFMHALHLCFMLLTSAYLPVATKTRICGGFGLTIIWKFLNEKLSLTTQL